MFDSIKTQNFLFSDTDDHRLDLYHVPIEQLFGYFFGLTCGTSASSSAAYYESMIRSMDSHSAFSSTRTLELYDHFTFRIPRSRRWWNFSRTLICAQYGVQLPYNSVGITVRTEAKGGRYVAGSMVLSRVVQRNWVNQYTPGQLHLQ